VRQSHNLCDTTDHAPPHPARAPAQLPWRHTARAAAAPRPAGARVGQPVRHHRSGPRRTSPVPPHPARAAASRPRRRTAFVAPHSACSRHTQRSRCDSRTTCATPPITPRRTPPAAPHNVPGSAPRPRRRTAFVAPHSACSCRTSPSRCDSHTTCATPPIRTPPAPRAHGTAARPSARRSGGRPRRLYGCATPSSTPRLTSATRSCS
jgi:hypothetical protein